MMFLIDCAFSPAIWEFREAWAFQIRITPPGSVSPHLTRAIRECTQVMALGGFRIDPLMLSLKLKNTSSVALLNWKALHDTTLRVA